MQRHLSVRSLIIILMVIFASACSVTSKVWTPYDNITVQVDQRVNPDGNDEDSPIQVKIYQLSARSTFDNLDFDRAFYQADQMLSDQLLSQVEFTLQPGEKLEHKVVLQQRAKYIAVVAGFIDIDNARWKDLYEVSPHGHYRHQVRLAGTRLEVLDPREQRMRKLEQGRTQVGQAQEMADVDYGLDNIAGENLASENLASENLVPEQAQDFDPVDSQGLENNIEAAEEATSLGTGSELLEQVSAGRGVSPDTVKSVSETAGDVLNTAQEIKDTSDSIKKAGETTKSLIKKW